MSAIQRRGVLLDGIGSELVRSANGGRRKTLSQWLANISDEVAQTFTSGDATPSVLNGAQFITAGSTAITDFDDAIEGQVIFVYRGNADITITRDATKIETLTAANVTLTATHPMVSFRSVSGIWQEVERADSAIKATGSITARTLADRFAASKDVRDFGAVWDGSSHPLSGYYGTLAAAQAVYPHATALTNEIDWAATQAAVNALAVTGGDVVLPQGVGLFDQTLVLGDGTSSSKSTRVGIRLRSVAGAGGSSDRAEYTTPGEGCRVLWNGADSTSAAMLDVRGPIHSIRAEGIVFDCAGLAGIGIKIRNLFNSRFENVRVTEWTTLAWDFQSYDAALPSGVTLHSVHNVFINCGCFTPWDSGAFTNTANALKMHGGPVENAGMSRNVFIGGDWHYGGAANTYGLELYYADNNLFQGMLFTNVSGGGAGNDVRLVKNTVGSNIGLFPLENTFIQCPGIESIGVFDDGGSAISPGSGGIGSNLFLGYSTSDGAAVPTHEGVTALLHTGELTNLLVRDDRFILKDNSDGTKRLQFQLSGITTATTRTITIPDASFTAVGADTAQTLTSKTIALGSNTVSGTVAEFNAALTGADFYTSGGTDVAVADGGTGASTAPTARTNLGLIDGTWTPTLTSISNLGTLTAYAGQYTRIGDVVTFSLIVGINPTAATTETKFGISLPVASNFASVIQAAGAGACHSVSNAYPVTIYADATNDRLEAIVYPLVDTDQLWSISGSYRVI